jgi:hypothetical protein
MAVNVYCERDATVSEPFRDDLNDEDGPQFAFGCQPCRTQWIRLTFEQGKEETWESEAKARLDQHLARFHKGET